MVTSGRCLCGGARYEIDGALDDASHCHCSMCRREHGAAFGTYADCDPNAFRWVSGEDLVAVYHTSPSVGWGFCRTCGSTLTEVRDGKITAVTLGTVDGDPQVRPTSHIFVGSKAPWYEIEDDLPQFDEWPPDQ